MKRRHHIDSEEISEEGITIGSVHGPDLKTVGQEEARQLIVTIGNFVRCIPPISARIKDIGRRQNQSPPRIEKIIDPS